MSSIEEKIVSMKFDNKNFTREIDNAIKSLENFKKSLKMDDAAQGFDKISKSAKDANKNMKMDDATKGLKEVGKTAKETAKEVQMDGADKGLKAIDKAAQDTAKSVRMEGADKGLKDVATAAENVKMDEVGNAAEGAKSKFSALEIAGVACMVNIANKALETGKQILSAFTIDPIMDGFREYETQMNSVQTILANTKSKGTTIKDVNGALSELNTYADKTIYNFTEMTRNIGTFTAAGVDLEKSTKAIKGIANLAAVSGSSSAQASNAMYQLSQALASGRVTLEDWNSVVNAGMGGEVFQKALQRTAKVMGKTIDESESFRESVSAKNGSESWLTSDVLIETLNEFTGDMTEAELASKGYNEEQIKEIMDMADTAQQAATRVKTFTQLIDTLKEAVGSGWTQTWQYIFGDFEEAREMWTDISNFLSDGINAYSDARNNMLGDWYELGGRTELLEGLKNVALSLVDVFKAVGGAFSEIFPQTTGQQLYDLTVRFKEFTSNFKMSTENLDKLKATFKGFFSLIDIGKEFLLGLAKGILTVFSGCGNLGVTLLNVTAGLGNFITSIRNSIKETDLFGTIFTTIGGLIRDVLTDIGSFGKSIGNICNNIWNALSRNFNLNNFNGLTNVLSSVTSGFKNFGNTLEWARGILGSGFEKAASVTSKAFVKISQVFDRVCNSIKSGISFVLEKIDEMGLTFDKVINGIGKALKTISFASLGLAISNFIKSITKKSDESFLTKLFDVLKEGIDKVSETITGKVDDITGILDGVRSSMEEYQKNLKASILLKIAAAIAMLAASIKIISTIDGDKLASSLAAIGGLFAELLVASKLYSKIGEFSASATKASIVLLSMSASILILATAMKKISDLNIQQMSSSVLALVVMMSALTKSVGKLSNGGQFVKGATNMIAFAVAIKILASAVEDLGNLNFGETVTGLIGLLGIMKTLSVFLNKTDFSKIGLKAATSMILIGSAMKVFASACDNFGELNWEEIGKGLTGMGGVLAEFSIFSRFQKESSNLIKASASMVVVGASMEIFADVMSKIGNLDWASIGKSLSGIGGVLSELAVFNIINKYGANFMKAAVSMTIIGGSMEIFADIMSKIGNLDWASIGKSLSGIGGVLIEVAAFEKILSGTKGLITSAASLTIVAAALNLIYTPMEQIGRLNWEQLAKGLVGIGGCLTEIVIALKLIPNDFGTAGIKMIEAATAILILGNAISTIGNLSWEQLAKGLVGIAGGLTAMTVALNLMPKDMLLTSAGIIGISTAMVIMAGAMTLMGSLSWESIIKGFVGLGGALTIFGAAALLLGPIAPSMIALAAALGVFGVAALAITGSVYMVGAAISSLIQAFIDLSNVPSEALNAVSGALSTLLNAVLENVPIIIEIVKQCIVGVLTALTEAVPQFGEFVRTCITELCTTVTTSFPQLLDMILQCLNNILDAIIQWGPTLINKGLDILLQLLTTLGSRMGDFTNVAVNICIAFINGIANKMGDITNAAFNLIISFINGLAVAVNNHNGELISAAGNLVKAFVNAIKNFVSEAISVGGYIVEGFVKGIKGAISKVGNAAAGLGRLAINATKKAIDSNSPSKEFETLGMWCDYGMANGFTNNTDVVTSASENLGLSALDAMRQGISGISNILTDNIEEPSITPVIDLSQIQNGTKTINDLMNFDDFGIQGTVEQTVNASRSLNRIVTPDNSESIKQTTETNITEGGAKPAVLQLVLQNGQAIAEYIVDDIDSLMGKKSKIQGRKLGYV